MRTASTGLAAASVLLLGTGFASAQKAQDTLRIAINDPVEVFSPYDRPNEETATFYSEVNPTFLRRDEYADKLTSDYVTSWKRVDDRTLEFEVREGITFHSGNTFGADDIVYMVNWASDPNVKLPNKGAYRFFQGAEKVGPKTVRIRTKEVYASDLTALAYRFYVIDSQVHKSLANPTDYGRVSGSGTGPYRMASLDRNKGIVLERFDGFKGDPKYSRAPIKRVMGIPIPDGQTQQAQLATGGIDVLRNVGADTAKELAKHKDLSVTAIPSGTYLYIQIDSINRSGAKALTDLRVRKAIVMAINRKEIADNFVAGSDKAEIMDTVCFKWTTGCSWSTKPYPFDPEGAKKLLAEAGYPDGLDLEFFVHAPYKDAAEAAAGQLRKIGVRTTVQPLTISLYFKKRDSGELPLFMAVRPTGSFPEVLATFDSFFTGPRDYWKDPLILDAWKKGAIEPDPAKRGEILRPALDRMNTEAYVLPITSVPTVFVTSKSVRVERNLSQTGDITVADFFWN